MKNAKLQPDYIASHPARQSQRFSVQYGPLWVRFVTAHGLSNSLHGPMPILAFAWLTPNLRFAREPHFQSLN